LTTQRPTWLAIWGKSSDATNAVGAPSCHPLICHLLDVAAVADALLARSDLADRLAKRLGTTGAAMRHMLVFCCALHDIGKCEASFQAKVPTLWPGLIAPVFGSMPTSVVDPPPHGDTSGYYLYNQKSRDDAITDGCLAPWLAQACAPLNSQALGPILSAIAGHHGSPFAPEAQHAPQLRKGVVHAAFSQAAYEMVAELARIIGVDGLPGAEAAGDKDIAALSWALSALLPVCDWIASSQRWFPARPDISDLDAYWIDHARPQAEAALHASGILPAAVTTPEPTRTLRHLAGAELSPLQAHAFSCPLGDDGPALFLIEDATGAGKTEAALALAHRLMAGGRASGFYFGLPTMATANAMYGRLAESYPALFADGPAPSLALAHGKALRNETFLASIGSRPGGNGAGEAETSAFCSGWIADNRRKALLAQAGAGTIDQALMAVLPMRYQSLRVHGLMGKVLILDEVHAFDPFMLRLIETLLELHAMLGGSAILMSATLPIATRQTLVRAFAKGLGLRKPKVSCNAYPLVTALTDSIVTETPLPLADRAQRRVSVARVATVEEAEHLALDLAGQGAAVALIRSTVDAAIASHARIAARHPQATLFHARFLMDDRLAIEQDVLARFGKAGDPQRPRAGHVLVATQVVEQSLDLDFDVLITDLAPVDLLIQRAGRLWRHQRADRPAAVPEPVLRVIAPEPLTTADTGWLDEHLPEATWVYQDTALLWLSAQRLFAAGAIETTTLAEGEQRPAHVRCLVEAVYAAEPEELPTEALRREWDGQAGKRMGLAQSADGIRLSPVDGYIASVPWESEARASTRLELQERFTVRLARRDGTAFVALGADWSLSELRLTPKQAGGLQEPSLAESRALRPAWPEADKGVRLLLLEPDSTGGWRSSDGRHRYDAIHGLRVSGPDGEGSA
jgi:CRISPR-associated endonuclease/helicase Cas3